MHIGSFGDILQILLLDWVDSGPVVLAGWQQGLPTLLLEQNVIPGITNRILARFVSAAAVSYEAALPCFGTKGFVSGNPVRQGFFAAPPARLQMQEARVLVIGGSQGAHAINVAMVKASKTILASSRPIHLIHQTGTADFDFVRREYQLAGLSARVEPFIDQMDSEMAKADLIVCRAGATTLAEVSAAGRAAIVIPFPHATHDHQRRNAIKLSESGAVEVIDPLELSGTVLGSLVVSLACNDVRRVALAERSKKFTRPKAACCIVDKMEQLFDQNNSV
jgi:UDP-N-acetylglucosamine--N-acetylmuramyl-(pentapeptide) pyrophosphoryl-undecaprenol N-acetylglucosamine transferase